MYIVQKICNTEFVNAEQANLANKYANYSFSRCIFWFSRIY
jgi:hypothetical protein